MSKLSALAIPYVLILDGDAAKAQQTLVSPHPAFVTFASKTPGLAEMTEREDDMQLHAAGRTFVTVKRTAKLRMEPKTRALIIDISKAAIGRPLEVVVTLSKWTCVIVPGYGFGWVGNAAILTRDEREFVPRQAIPLRSFMWICYPQVTAYNIRSLEPLLELIGQGLTALYLCQTQVTDEEIERILSHCPSLKHLEIPLHKLRSLSFLHEDASRWICTLNLRSQASRYRFPSEPDDTNTTISDLKSFLTQPASRRLQKLAFDISQDSSKHEEELVSILSQHLMLEVIDVTQTDSQGGDYIHDQFMTLNDQMVGLRSPPVANKLAFLSVIHQNEGALGRLDTALISIILHSPPETSIVVCTLASATNN